MEAREMENLVFKLNTIQETELKKKKFIRSAAVLVIILRLSRVKMSLILIFGPFNGRHSNVLQQGEHRCN